MAYERFEQDIQGKNTNLVPVVVIGVLGDWSDKKIYLSTNNISLDVVDQGESIASEATNEFFSPILLNIPSIKQSVDIENRRFKISSVSLDISNYEYEGKRFSDNLEESSMINRPVSIYWTSQSSKIIVPEFMMGAYELGLGSGWDDYDLEAAYGRECLPIYHGQVRRITHDLDKVRLELEDLTEQKAHKDLPQELLPSDDSISDRYKNKPIPFVYGHVDRSPVVLTNGGIEFVADTKDIYKLIEFDNWDGKEFPLSLIHI